MPLKSMFVVSIFSFIHVPSLITSLFKDTPTNTFLSSYIFAKVIKKKTSRRKIYAVHIRYILIVILIDIFIILIFILLFQK